MIKEIITLLNHIWVIFKGECGNRKFIILQRDIMLYFIKASRKKVDFSQKVRSVLQEEESGSLYLEAGL